MFATFGVANFTDRGIEDDNRKFRAYGINPASAEAVPYYAQWTRQDLIGVFFLLGRIANLALLNAALLAVIAVALWNIALR